MKITIELDTTNHQDLTAFRGLAAALEAPTLSVSVDPKLTPEPKVTEEPEEPEETPEPEEKPAPKRRPRKAAAPKAEPEADEPEADEPEADEPEADEPEADEPEADDPVTQAAKLAAQLIADGQRARVKAALAEHGNGAGRVSAMTEAQAKKFIAELGA